MNHNVWVMLDLRFMLDLSLLYKGITALCKMIKKQPKMRMKRLWLILKNIWGEKSADTLVMLKK